MSDDFERHVADMVKDLREAMARRRASKPDTDEPGEAWDAIALALCTHVGSFGGPLFGEVIVERLIASAPALPRNPMIEKGE